MFSGGIGMEHRFKMDYLTVKFIITRSKYQEAS